jgi:hypothetical protein
MAYEKIGREKTRFTVHETNVLVATHPSSAEVRPFPSLKLFFIRSPGDEKFYGLHPFLVTLCCQHGRPERMEFRPQRSRSVQGPPRSLVRGAWG